MKLLAEPMIAKIHIQNTAPAPPAEIAATTPTRFPMPTRVAVETISACSIRWNGIPSTSCRLSSSETAALRSPGISMPPGIPVATVGINASLNAGILAVQMLAVGDEALQTKLAQYKEDLKKKIVKANEDLAKVSFKFKTN